MRARGGPLIVVGKESNIGSMDLHCADILAHGVSEEFVKAIGVVNVRGARKPILPTVNSKSHPSFLGARQKAIELFEIYQLFGW